MVFRAVHRDHIHVHTHVCAPIKKDKETCNDINTSKINNSIHLYTHAQVYTYICMYMCIYIYMCP